MDISLITNENVPNVKNHRVQILELQDLLVKRRSHLSPSRMTTLQSSHMSIMATHLFIQQFVQICEGIHQMIHSRAN